MPPQPAKAKARASPLRSAALWIAAAAGAAAIGWGIYWGQMDDGPAANAENAAQVAQGRKVYGRQCASCHGATLGGQPNWRQRRPNGRLPAPPHDQTGHTWHHPDEQLFAMTKQGTAAFAGRGYRSDMPAYAGRLSDSDIWAVIAFIKSRWPQSIRQRQAAISRRARQR